MQMGDVMATLNVVLYQYDPRAAQALASSLSQQSLSVHLARNHDDLRPAIAKNRAEVLVLDMETFSCNEVEQIHHEFPSLSIVCTHRLADDELWTAALSHGAADMCTPRQDEVVRSVMREQAHRTAA